MIRIIRSKIIYDKSFWIYTDGDYYFFSTSKISSLGYVTTTLHKTTGKSSYRSLFVMMDEYIASYQVTVSDEMRKIKKLTNNIGKIIEICDDITEQVSQFENNEWKD